jgi:hypothetical protein
MSTERLITVRSANVMQSKGFTKIIYGDEVVKQLPVLSAPTKLERSVKVVRALTKQLNSLSLLHLWL